MRLARFLGKSIVAQKAEFFWQQVKKVPKVTKATAFGECIQYPALPGLDPNRFDISQQNVDIFHTEFKQSLFDEVQKLTWRRGLRVRGPSGVGKSHAQFAVMMRLYQEEGYRILFANCALWFIAEECDYLKDAFERAFAQDDDILRAIENTDFSSFLDVTAFVSKTVVEYLERNKLVLVVSVDQFNNAPKEKIRTHPFSIILRMAADDHFSRVRVVITYSISHFLSGQVPRDPLAEWLTFTWYSGLTDNEFSSWCTKYNLPYTSTIARLTGKYPLELYRAKHILERNPNISEEQLSQEYIREATTYLETKTGELLTAGMSLQPNFAQLAAAPALFAGKKKFNELPTIRFMDGRFFFINSSDHIEALTPTFARIVSSFWLNVLATTAENSHIVDIMKQDKNCAGALVDVLIKQITKQVFVHMVITHLASGNSRGINSSPTPIVFREFPKSWDQDMLLLPYNNNYCGVDFFLWLADEEELLAFQVTVGKKHSDTFAEQTRHDETNNGVLSPKQAVQNHLIACGKQNAVITVVWVVTEMMPLSKWVERGDYFCHLASLHYLHPILRDYSFAELGRLINQATISEQALPAILADMRAVWQPSLRKPQKRFRMKMPTTPTMILLSTAVILTAIACTGVLNAR